ncbi:S-layer homology domain-containing protein [Cohnella sp. JJ-181]|uniref:S-layer homology domain-containing protein n=1 Tax=Cohnella rhizoplanae TaxID=2974897 RepID=UPI0022FF6FC2|nr:S-layer homology domain-containing protein [Cohnella sp. JJ-181]CAI6086917.1 hypothetical protein COHCIP112018_05237 [Cohnella sp. JJ-181]
MNRRLSKGKSRLAAVWMLALALAVQLGAAGAASAAAAAPGGHAVSGTVTTESGVPLRAQVLIYKSTLESVTELTAGADGAFEATLPDGDYVLDVKPQGAYVPALGREFAVAQADLSLDAVKVKPGYAYTGTVVYRGQPLANVRVQAQTAGDDPELVDYGYTDGDGRYAVVLPDRSGDYDLVVPNPDPAARAPLMAEAFAKQDEPGGIVVAQPSGTNGAGVKTTFADGKALVAVDLGAARAAIRASADKTFVVRADGDAPATEVTLPADLLGELAAKGEGAAFRIAAGPVEYALPADLFKLGELRSLLGAGADAPVELKIAIVLAPAAQSAAIGEAADRAGGRLLGSPVAFAIRAVSGGKSVTLDDFGGTYVERTLLLQGDASLASSVAGVVYADDGSIRHVPTLVFPAGDGKLKITLMRSGNSVYAAIVFAPAAFADVPERHWASGAIGYMSSQQILKGQGGGKFAPDAGVTRAEMAAMLVRALGLLPAAYDGRFADVKADAWYAGELQAAVDAGIVKGASPAAYEPQRAVTRQELTAMVAGAMRFAGQDAALTAEQADRALSAFADRAEIAPYAADAAAFAVSEGIVTGMDADTFAPKLGATRAQASAMTLRMLQALGFANP